MKRIVVFSGAGMSAESGLSTFRDSGGLWEQYDIHEVATPEAWDRNPALVLEFYNMRRRQVLEAMPNRAHHALVELENLFDVRIVTQNIDNLHERAGSSNVLHVHGEIMKARSSRNNASELFEIDRDLKIGDQAPDGSQLRPHVVWFGEEVPEYDNARKIISTADILIIVGTSLNVYPAAGLVFHAPPKATVYLVDPAEVPSKGLFNVRLVKNTASEGIPTLVRELLGTPVVD